MDFFLGWFNRLKKKKKRYGIHKLDAFSEQRSADEVSENVFIKQFRKTVDENNMTAEQVYNVDETGLLWWCLSMSTLAF